MPHPSLRLTPHAHLIFEDASDAPELDARVAARLAEAFSRGSGEGLLRLGAGEVGQALPPLFLWWRGGLRRWLRTLSGEREETLGMDLISALCESACQFAYAVSESHVPSEAAHKSLSLVNK